MLGLVELFELSAGEVPHAVKHAKNECHDQGGRGVVSAELGV